MSAAGRRVCVALMSSVHDVMAAERALTELGLVCDLVPVPRQLSSECGMAVEIPCDFADRLREVCEEKSLRLESIYRQRSKGGDDKWEPVGPREEDRDSDDGA